MIPDCSVRVEVKLLEPIKVSTKLYNANPTEEETFRSSGSGGYSPFPKARFPGQILPSSHTPME